MILGYLLRCTWHNMLWGEQPCRDLPTRLP